MVFLIIKDLIDEREEAVSTAIDFLRDGKIIVYPTDTVYGVGVDATDGYAVRKVFDVKKRSLTKPISIMVSDKSMIEEYAEVEGISDEIIDEFLPGPLTLLLPKKDLPDVLTADQRKVGVRLIDGPVRDIISEAGFPITTTSANISGRSSSRNFGDAIKDLDVDLGLDGGECPGGTPSTVFDPEEWKVIREGPVKKEEIDDLE